MKEIKRGSTPECLGDYGSRLPSGRNSRKAREPMQRFTGVHLHTVDRWVRGNFIPKGESLIKLRFFLWEMGYEVEELLALSPEVFESAKLVSYGIFSVQQLAKEARMKDQQLMGYFAGRASPTQATLLRITSISKSFRDEVEIKRKGMLRFIKNGIRAAGLDWLGREVLPASPIHPNMLSEVNAIKAPPAVEALDATKEYTAKKDEEEGLSQQKNLKNGITVPLDMVAVSLKASIQALLPYLELLNSDDFTPSDRKRVRELVGEDDLFVLSTELNRLCSEAARRQFSR